MVITAYVVRIIVFCCKQKTAYEMRSSDWSSDVCSSDLEIGLAGYDQRMRTRQSHIVPAHMRHLDGGIVPLDQPHSAGNPSESLMTAIFLTPLREQLHADANAKIGRASCRERVCQYV